MAIAAGRFIKDGDVLFAGTGVAMLAATVAKRIHAPHAHIFFETGGIGPLLEELPMAVADPRVMAFSNLNAGLVEAFSYVANRRLNTIAFLGAAQVDKYGNMNSTVIGDYAAPTVRFSGSGGACDAGSLASGYIIFMQHGVQEVRREARLPDHAGLARGRRLAPPRRVPPRRPHRRGHQPLRAAVPRGDARDVPGRALRGRHARARPGEHRLRAGRVDARPSPSRPRRRSCGSCATTSTRSA